MKINSLLLLLALITTFAAAGQARRNIGKSCATPDHRFGKCKPLHDCPVLLEKTNNVTNETRIFLRKCRCGWFVDRKPVVCCPHDNYQLINSDTCGRATGSRIFNGKETQLSEFPWMALLGYTRGGDSLNLGNPTTHYKCGGSLISSRFVLTAAHCLHSTLSTVRLGEHDLRNETDCNYYEDGEECAPPVQDIKIKRQIRHPRYRFATNTNDIALLELETDADLNLGFGSDVLLKVKVPIVPNPACNAVYKGKYQKDVFPTHLCAGGVSGKKTPVGDSCSGDSGGPLNTIDLLNGSPRNIQFGIVCAGPSDCATPGVPGMYTRVSSYMEWILDHLTPT